MRRFAALLALLAASAHSAEFQVRLPTYCSAVGTYFTTQAGCPIGIELTAGANVGEAVSDAEVILTGNVSGTLYVCLDTDTFDSDVDGVVDTDRAADCVNNSGMAARQTLAVSSAGTYSFSDGGDAAKLSGLTNGTTYYSAAVVIPSGSYANRPDTTRDDDVFPPFSTVASGGSGLEAGNVRFVSSTGNDSNDGLTMATAWQTIAKVNAAGLPIGTDVYFKRGDTWTGEALDIFSGASGDRAIFGCYYSDGGTATSCDSGATPISVGDSDMPKIQGSLTQAAIDAKNVNWTTDFGGCGSLWDGQISAVGVDHFTIQDLKIELTKCRGISLKGSSGLAEGQLTNFTIQRNWIRNTGITPIIGEAGVQDGIIRDNRVEYFNMCEGSERTGGTDAGGTANCGSGGWPGGVQIARSINSRILIENNYVGLGYGEGIGVLRAGTVVIRGNRVGNVHSSQIYADNTLGETVVVESNIVWGAPDDDTGMGAGTNPNWFGFGFLSTNVENSAYDASENNGGDAYHVIARSNICVQCGLSNTSLQSSAGAAGWDVEVELYGNTAISISEAGRRFDIWNNIAGNIGFYKAKNNIVYQPGRTTADRCQTGVASDYNGLDSAVDDSDCGGANDETGDPKFTETTYANFAANDYADQPTLADVVLLGTSPFLTDADTSIFTEECIAGSEFDTMISSMTYPFAPSAALWDNCNYYTFGGDQRTNGWLGADD